jgi:hypothetical protein
MTCMDCGKPTDPYGHDTLEEVTGFVKYRGRKGGTNHVHHQVKTGRVLCGDCDRKRTYGVGAGQGSLLDAR